MQVVYLGYFDGLATRQTFILSITWRT